MEQLLTTLGALIVTFLVLSAAVESILEVFRGGLVWIGVKWPTGRVSMEEALQLAREFAPDDHDLHTKLEAVSSVADQVSSKAQTSLTELATIRQSLAAGGAVSAELAAKLNVVAAEVKAKVELAEQNRITVLRLLSAAIGVALVAGTGLPLLEQAFPDSASIPAWINAAVGGLAASAGSSYWHDKLDKVRNLKNVAQRVKSLA